VTFAVDAGVPKTPRIDAGDLASVILRRVVNYPGGFCAQAATCYAGVTQRILCGTFEELCVD
jgi:hypothetical protein